MPGSETSGRLPLAVSLPVSLGATVVRTSQDELLTPLTAPHTCAQDIGARLV
ncbi:hypothetical protein ACWGGS_03860 [Streptomyces decoyicus]